MICFFFIIFFKSTKRTFTFSQLLSAPFGNQAFTGSLREIPAGTRQYRKVRSTKKHWLWDKKFLMQNSTTPSNAYFFFDTRNFQDYRRVSRTEFLDSSGQKKKTKIVEQSFSVPETFRNSKRIPSRDFLGHKKLSTTFCDIRFYRSPTYFIPHTLAASETFRNSRLLQTFKKGPLTKLSVLRDMRDISVRHFLVIPSDGLAKLLRWTDVEQPLWSVFILF